MASYFAIFLVFLSFASGLIWLIDAKVWGPKRALALAEAEKSLGNSLDEETRVKIMRQSGIAETAQSIFPVVFAITIFRSFFYEPFQIPSGSMMPGLLVGDFILVEKYAYGVKDPVTRTKFIDTGLPKRGDVAVFKYPVDPLVDFIKRIVGLPGDRIVYKDRQLYIKPSCDNDPDRCDKFHKVESKQLSVGDFQAFDMPLTRFEADMFGVEFEYLTNPRLRLNEDRYEPKQAGTAVGEWVVPPGHYFAMGDNRDNSQDSRFWGFVPEENLVGRAMFIWMSFEFGRDENNWLLRKIPSDIRFERLGSF